MWQCNTAELLHGMTAKEVLWKLHYEIARANVRVRNNTKYGFLKQDGADNRCVPTESDTLTRQHEVGV
jgi:hypothetical protein